MSTILVTGSSSGLGKAIVAELKRYMHDVLEYDIANGDDVLNPSASRFHSLEQLDVLVNCAGVNKINWLQNVSEEEWDLVMDTNAKSIFKMTQHFLPLLKTSKGSVVSVVSNAAKMPMRCSLAYNASKGAALIMTKQLARELTSQGVTVFSVSPNKLKGTGMSDDIDEQVVKTRGWTKEQAQAYQLQGLLTGEETPPEAVAEFVAFLLSSKERHKFLAGCDLPYGA